jgi:hypothetical protein
MSTKDTFFSLGTFRLKDGNQIRLWEDTWLGNRPLKTQNPTLLNIVSKKQAEVANVLS